jgi:hypothetical protein
MLGATAQYGGHGFRNLRPETRDRLPPGKFGASGAEKWDVRTTFRAIRQARISRNRSLFNGITACFTVGEISKSVFFTGFPQKIAA